MGANGDHEFVVDASYTLAFLLPDERNEQVVSTFRRYAEHEMHLVSIPLLPLEVGNGLKLAVARKRIEPVTAFELVRSFLHHRIPLVEIGLEQIWETAEREQLTMYDAAYLVLARQRNLPLLSFDKHLLRFAYQGAI